MNNQVVREIKMKIKKYLETSENGNTKSQKLWDAVKTVLRGKFLALNTYIKKKSQINNLTLNLKELEEQTKPEVSRRKDIE